VFKGENKVMKDKIDALVMILLRKLDFATSSVIYLN